MFAKQAVFRLQDQVFRLTRSMLFLCMVATLLAGIAVRVDAFGRLLPCCAGLAARVLLAFAAISRSRRCA